MKKVLEGVRVIDFGRYIAAPYCGALLAEFGADVIRVERRTGGEDRFQSPLTEQQDGATFLQMNRNKRGMTLDPMKPGAKAVVERLVKSANVVIANLPPATLKSMGLDYESLTAIKPDIILTMNTAYGRGGPYSERVGFDAVGQAMCGSMWLTSDGEDERPYRFQSPWVDFMTATHCAYGTLLALMHHKATGEGQVVEGALLASAVNIANPFLMEQAVLGIDRVPTGNRGQTAAPVDVFKCRDGWVLVQVIGQPLYERWVKLMGEEHWLTDPRFKDDISRGENAVAISERMAAWCAERAQAEVVSILGDAKIPCGPVLRPQQTLEDPHVKAMGFLQPVDYPGLPKPAPVSRAPVYLSKTPGVIENRAPTLGEHTDAILGELGFSAAEIAGLREERII